MDHDREQDEVDPPRDGEEPRSLTDLTASIRGEARKLLSQPASDSTVLRRTTVQPLNELGRIEAKSVYSFNLNRIEPIATHRSPGLCH
ncbi:hypothetical protein B0T17DRAFT_83849 [Bombardia bombarda]|uniref:Uncharacterized protein n=1 Tax=Bombardia bombarda TaxID=252184 RepID=A0AA39XM15_9PEZI|nr:hypothetical protein B0T17DRAFT_83849 [Bombardia bombarda]